MIKVEKSIYIATFVIYNELYLLDSLRYLKPIFA